MFFYLHQTAELNVQTIDAIKLQLIGLRLQLRRHVTTESPAFVFDFISASLLYVVSLLSSIVLICCDLSLDIYLWRILAGDKHIRTAEQIIYVTFM